MSIKGDVIRYEGIFTLLSYALVVIIFASVVIGGEAYNA